MKSRKPILLRINPRLFDALEAWAQQEMRSVNGQIEYLLKEAVLNRDRKFSDRLEAEPEAEDATEPEQPDENS